MTELEKQLLEALKELRDAYQEFMGVPAVKANAAIAAAKAAKPAPNYPAVPEGWAPVKSPITEDMHRAAVKVLVRANGVDGLPQRMLDAMVATAPPATVKDSLIVQQAPAVPDEWWNAVQVAADEMESLIDEVDALDQYCGSTTPADPNCRERKFVDELRALLRATPQPAQVEQQAPEGNAVELSDDEICTMAKSYRRVECHVPVYAFNRRELVAFARRVVATQRPARLAAEAKGGSDANH